MSGRRRGLPIRRDSLLFGLGALGIGYQQLTERYYVPLLVIYGLMAGVPGLAQLIIALRSLGTETDEEGGSSTPSTPSSPVPLPHSPSPTL